MADAIAFPDAALLDRFAAIVGERYALRSPEDVAPYVTERRGLWPGRSPLVLRPGSVEEVSRVMRLASESRTPVVPQGGNTGLVGGQVPSAAGNEIVLSLSRLDRIREVDLDSGTITAEAGVILQNLRGAADAADRLFPLSLASQGSCQIGGNLSANAGGTGVLAYGNARELCLGLEVVLPTGEILDDLRKLKKDNTGYDLKNLFIGAEGTLGVITAAVMKLVPKPRGREMAWVALESLESAVAFFNHALTGAGSGLTAFELLGRRSLEFTVRHVPGTVVPLPLDWPWHVMMEVSSGRSADEARQLTEEILGAALERGIVGDAVIAQSLAQGARFWTIRETLPEAQTHEGASIKHDISVPIAAIPQFVRRGEPLVQEVCPGARVVCFGHMGDGNLHYNISRPVDGSDRAFLDLYRKMNNAVHGLVRELGGSISAEHGIGQLKRDELPETMPAIGVDLMRRIKAAFDPAGIMNPGKVI